MCGNLLLFKKHKSFYLLYWLLWTFGKSALSFPIKENKNLLQLVNEEGNNLTPEAVEYLEPLVSVVPTVMSTSKLPEFKVFNK